MSIVFSPDVILCGWLGSKYQLTNYPPLPKDVKIKGLTTLIKSLLPYKSIHSYQVSSTLQVNPFLPSLFYPTSQSILTKSLLPNKSIHSYQVSSTLQVNPFLPSLFYPTSQSILTKSPGWSTWAKSRKDCGLIASQIVLKFFCSSLPFSLLRDMKSIWRRGKRDWLLCKTIKKTISATNTR